MGTAPNTKQASRSQPVGLPRVPFEHITNIVEILKTAGRPLSYHEVKASFGRGNTMTRCTLSAAQAMGFVERRQGMYALTARGIEFATGSEEQRRSIVREWILSYSPYHSVLLRMKTEPAYRLSLRQIADVFLARYQTGGERTRLDFARSFVSIAAYAGLVEATDDGARLTSLGLRALEAPVQLAVKAAPLPAHQPSPRTPTTSLPTHHRLSATVPLPARLHPATVSVAIRITANASDDRAVENVLRIIRALQQLTTSLKEAESQTDAVRGGAEGEESASEQ